MGTLSIDYSQLSNAANHLKNGASACRRYSERLNDRCQNKLSSIEGGLTGRVWDAYAEISAKRSDLENKSDRLDALSAAVTRLRDYAKEQDRAVSQDIENRASAFQTANGMECSWIESAWAWLCDGVRSLLNATALGRMVADAFRLAGDWLSDKWRRLRSWMDYEGGKFLVNIGMGVLAVAVAVAGIITAGTGILAAIAVVGSVIAIANGIVKIVQNIYALSTYEDNPYAAEKAAKVDTASDLLRDKAETVDNEFLRGFMEFSAGTIDVVDGFCAVVGLFDSATKAYETFTGKQTLFQKYLGKGGAIDSLFTKDTIDNSRRVFDPVKNKWFQLDANDKPTIELDFSQAESTKGMKLDFKTGLQNLRSALIPSTTIDGATLPRVTGFDMLKAQFVDDFSNLKSNYTEAFHNVVNQFHNFAVNGHGAFRYTADAFGDLLHTGTTDRSPFSVAGGYASGAVDTFKKWTGIDKVCTYFKKFDNFKKFDKKDWLKIALDTPKTLKTAISIPENVNKFFSGDWHEFGDIGTMNKLTDKLSGDRWKDWCASIRESVYNLGRPKPSLAVEGIGTGGIETSDRGGPGGGGGGFARFR